MGGWGFLRSSSRRPAVMSTALPSLTPDELSIVHSAARPLQPQAVEPSWRRSPSGFATVGNSDQASSSELPARSNANSSTRLASTAALARTDIAVINQSISSCTFLLTGHPCANCKTTQKKSGFSTKNHRSNMPPDSAFTYGLINKADRAALGLCPTPCAARAAGTALSPDRRVHDLSTAHR